MSLRVLNQVKMAKVSPTQKLVLLCLADCHNGETGRCDPTQAFMMAFTGLSNRSVSTAVMDLERFGLIRRHTQVGTRSTYSFPKTCEAVSQVFNNEPAKEVHKPVNLLHPGSTFTSEPPAESCESPAGVPVNLPPKAVKEVHTNREEQGNRTRRTGKLEKPEFNESDSPEFIAIMTEWFENKREKRENYTLRGWRALLTMERRFPIPQLRASVLKSISVPWKGLFTSKVTEEEIQASEPLAPPAQGPVHDPADDLLPRFLANMEARRKAEQEACGEPPAVGADEEEEGLF